MNTQDRIWIIIGSFFVLLVSSLLFVARGPSILAPMPMYLVIMGWMVSYFSVAVMPALFAFQFMLFRNSSKFGLGLILACLIIVVLNVWWFIAGWSYGYKYQGHVHTKIVALENMVGFGVVILLSLWATIKNHKFGLYLANVILFILISWCAFPYLGELP